MQLPLVAETLFARALKAAQFGLRIVDLECPFCGLLLNPI